MIIQCVKCKNDLPVPDVVFKFGIPKLVCPMCKMMFRPVMDYESNGNKTVLLNRDNRKPRVFGKLIVNDENGSSQYELLFGKQLVGRKNKSKKCDIMVDTDDMQMSRNHFYIDVRASNEGVNFMLSDAGSSNQTWLNNRKIDKNDNLLKNGDVILAGNTNIIFRTDANTANSNAIDATVLIRTTR